jgi:hypothetical protein
MGINVYGILSTGSLSFQILHVGLQFLYKKKAGRGSDHLNGLDIIENLIDKAMLYVYSSGEGTGKISLALCVGLFNEDIGDVFFL